jgi:hypothetical protein
VLFHMCLAAESHLDVEGRLGTLVITSTVKVSRRLLIWVRGCADLLWPGFFYLP